MVFNPYPEAQHEGRVVVDFRLEIRSPQGATLASEQTRLQADNSDVVYLEDWSRVFQGAAISPPAEPNQNRWLLASGEPAAGGASLGNYLAGDAGPDVPLPPLSYPLDLKGWYAVFVHGRHDIALRLTGDERIDGLSSRPMG